MAINTPEAGEYGLQTSKAKEIKKMFQPMLDKMEELEKEHNEIVSQEITPELSKQAREVRLKLVKVRTGTAKIHKELKDFYLKGGRFVDGWKNAQLMASKGLEENLENIEKHYENLEKQRIAELQEERAEIIRKLDPHSVTDQLGAMPESIWENYKFGVEAAVEARKKRDEEERKAREEQERKNKLHEERHASIVED